MVDKIQADNLYQQSLIVLQYSREELHKFIQQEYYDNPLLEYKASIPALRKRFILKKLCWIIGTSKKNKYDKQLTFRRRPILQIPNYSEEFKNNLKEQLYSREISGYFLNIVERMVALLDCRGYLPYTIVELTAILGCSRKDCNKALAILQNLPPCGVGHYDLRDFLIHQLEQKGIINKELQQICKYYLPHIETKNYQHIADALGVDTQLVGQYVKTISMLQFPIRYCTEHVALKHIVADVIIQQDGDVFSITFNNRADTIGISRYYQYYLKYASDPITKKYVQEKICRARWVCEVIGKRREIILSIAEQLTLLRREFFLDGKMHALTYREMAQHLNLHESTIALAVRGKYLLCNRGLYLFSQFFKLDECSMDLEGYSVVK